MNFAGNGYIKLMCRYIIVEMDRVPYHVKKILQLVVLCSFILTTGFSPVDQVQNRYETKGKIPGPVYSMWHSEKKTKVCYLTFDDGPSESSEKLMDLLNQYHAKATFFLLGKHILKFPEVVRDMRQEDFTIGLHGVSHDYKKLYRSEKSVVEDMIEDQKIIMDVTGLRTPFIRTPYGSYPFMKESYRRAVVNHGFIMWDWNVDSHDWRYRDWRFVQQTIKQIKKVEKEGQVPVLLLHDRTYTLRHIEALLHYLQQHQYQMKGIDASMNPLQFPLKKH